MSPYNKPPTVDSRLWLNQEHWRRARLGAVRDHWDERIGLTLPNGNLPMNFATIAEARGAASLVPQGWTATVRESVVAGWWSVDVVDRFKNLGSIVEGPHGPLIHVWAGMSESEGGRCGEYIPVTGSALPMSWRGLSGLADLEGSDRPARPSELPADFEEV